MPIDSSIKKIRIWYWEEKADLYKPNIQHCNINSSIRDFRNVLSYFMAGCIV